MPAYIVGEIETQKDFDDLMFDFQKTVTKYTNSNTSLIKELEREIASLEEDIEELELNQ